MIGAAMGALGLKNQSGGIRLILMALEAANPILGSNNQHKSTHEKLKSWWEDNGWEEQIVDKYSTFAGGQEYNGCCKIFPN